MSVITVGGLFGAGALEIGDGVAKALGFDYVERSALPMIAEEANATVEAVWLKENHHCTWKERLGGHLERMFTYSGMYASMDFQYGYMPTAHDPFFAIPESERRRQRPHEIPDQEYLDAIATVNFRLARRGELVLTLRGGCATLRSKECAFHVGVFAPMDHRVGRVAKRRGLSPLDAEEVIRIKEARRTDFFKRTLGTDQANPELYDLLINTSQMDDSKAIAQIVGMATETISLN